MKQKKLFSRTISLFLAVALVLSMMIIPAFAEDATENAQETTTYTVAFYNLNTDPDDSYCEITVESGYVLTADDFPDDPTREGYTFAGWVDYDTNAAATAGTTVTGDMLVYSAWEKIVETVDCTLAFYNLNTNPNDSYYDLTVQSGYVLTADDFPDDPTRDGYQFAGWIDFDTGETVTAGTAVNGDMLLFSDWDPLYTVALYDNASGSDPQFYDAVSGTSILSLLPEPAAGTHYTDSEGAIIAEDAVIDEADVSVYLDSCDYRTRITKQDDGSALITYTCKVCGYSYTSDDIEINEALVIHRGENYYQQYNVISEEADYEAQYPASDEDYEVLAGDWDGDGVDEIGIRVGNVYYFYYEEGSETADVVVTFGKSTDEVIAGDWDGDGIDTLAVRRYDNHYYFQAKPDSAELYADVTFGNADDEILAGDWDGDGKDTLAARRKASGDYSVNHYYFQSDVSKDETYKDIYYGKNDDEVLTGDWNGDGMDTLAVRRDGNHYFFQENLEDVWGYIDTYFGRATDEVLARLWI